MRAAVAGVLRAQWRARVAVASVAPLTVLAAQARPQPAASAPTPKLLTRHRLLRPVDLDWETFRGGAVGPLLGADGVEDTARQGGGTGAGR